MTEGPWWSSAVSQGGVLADAIRIRDRDIIPLNRLRDMLVGPDFAGSAPLSSDADRKPTNSTYGFFSRVYPACLGGDIRFSVDTDYGSPEEQLKLEYEGAVNEVFRRAGGREAIELVFADMICGYGGLYVKQGNHNALPITDADRADLRYPLGRKPWKEGAGTNAAAHEKPWMDAPPSMPEIHYLPPDSWGWDRRAFTFEQSEFFYYDTLQDYDELLSEAINNPDEGWDVAALRRAKDKLDQEDMTLLGGRKTERAEAERTRNRIRIRTLIVRNATIPGEDRPKHHNAVRYTLWSPYSSPSAAMWIRKPAYEFCPPWGPFILFRQHMVGVDSTPLNVLQANLTKLVATDEMHGVAFRRITEQRTVYGVDAAFSSQMQELEDANDGDLVPMRGLAEGNAVQAFMRGGLDAPTVAALQYMDAQLAKDLGLDDAARGATDGGDTTATESALANAQSNARTAQFREAFNRALAQAGRTIGWFCMYDPRLVVPLSFEARVGHQKRLLLQQGATEEEANAGALRAASTLPPNGRRLASQGGDFLHDEGLDPSAMRFSVRAQQQAFMSPQMRRMESAQLRQELQAILTLIPQMPYFDWIGELRQLEEDYGRRGLVERLSPSMASLMAQARLEQGQTEPSQPQMMADPMAGGGGGGGPRVTTQGAPVRGKMANLGGFAQPGQGLGGDA